MKAVIVGLSILASTITPAASFPAAKKPSFAGHWFAEPDKVAALCFRECMITQTDTQLVIKKPGYLTDVILRLDRPETTGPTTRTPTWDGETLVMTYRTGSGDREPIVSTTRFSLKDGNLIIDSAIPMLNGTIRNNVVMLSRTPPRAF